MKVLYPRCCGLDVHKEFVVACLLICQEDGRAQKQIRRFSTMTAELLQLSDWLKTQGCTHIAMESTGVYWRPVFALLEGAFEVLVVNAQHMKAVPGHKTDVKDAEWIADLLQHGLLKASFIPSQPQRDLRDLTRYRSSLIQERTRLANRLQKLLEEANLKLSSVVSDVQGKTSRLILHALAEGETNPAKLADLALAHMPQKRDALVSALDGRVREHHRFLLQELLDAIEYHDRAIARLDQQIERLLHPFQDMIQRLDAITGVSQGCLEVLCAEIGTDVNHFPDGAHLASWLGICPGNKESGGKRLSGRIRQGNRWAKTVLVQAAQAAARSKRTYLGALARRLRQRLGAKRATIAVAHHIVLIFYQMMATGQSYQEKGAEFFLRQDAEHVERRLVKQLERLGHQVILLPTASANA